MKYSGLWKIKAAQQWDEKAMGLVERNVEDILADQSLSDDDKKMLYSQFLFTDDGWIKTMLPIPEGMDKTFAELGTAFKNTISHRARALAELERLLEEGR